ncbi:NADPH-dependent F420 reductase [Actinophytocola sp.]|uniref:NADPH-dependent F420 reductase n=1 Tax=Actinophytocola sp. TaxID=1872138 RepID=UPI002ED14E8D
MTTLGLIGSGHIGSTVARLALAAGYDVVLSNSRGPETLTDLVTELGPKARAATAAGAARAGDIVVVSIPVKSVRDVPAEPLAGKVVIDTGNYYPARDGHFAELDSGELTTTELVARHLSGARVVKGFNNIFYRHLAELARPAGAPDRSAIVIAGDDQDAKKAASEFLDDIGYDTVDAGPLSEGWRFEPGTPAYGPPYAGGADNFWETSGHPAGVDTLREALAAAQR